MSVASELEASLAELACLVTGSVELTALLAQVAGFAQRAVPGADGAGIALLRVDDQHSRVAALAATAPFVSDIDTAQYETLGEGPGVTAIRELQVVRSGSIGGDQRWPRFGPRAGRLGVHSALSLPLRLPGQLIGAISVYARHKQAFDARAAELGELFAGPAAVAVHDAQVLAQARQLTDQLQAALASRPTIDQAVGILRARTGATEQEALQRLRSISQRDNVKLSCVAEQLVDEAVRRARARRGC